MLAATLALGEARAERSDSYDFGAMSKLTRNVAFQQFIEELWPEAQRAGISRGIFDAAFTGMTPDPKVIELNENQPEFNTPVWEYLATRVTDKRIKTGREQKARIANLLKALEERYGVDRHILLAIWGMETNFGSYKGNMSIVRSLATLAFTGQRQAFGRTQLVAALTILEKGDIDVGRFTGSWAGAMGHTQFIPTTYVAHAVDWDGDGKRDVWNTEADALASAGNYIAASGWKAGQPWGWEVSLPKGFDMRMLGAKGGRSVADWAKLGVKRADGEDFGVPGARAELILPAGQRGLAFLVTGNFKAILAYNNSTSYALSVGHLGDRIRGADSFRGGWPVSERRLTVEERRELQRLLTRHGFDPGNDTGRINRATVAAIQAYQEKSGIPADGYADLALLERLRKGP